MEDDINEFFYQRKPFSINIGPNYFSLDKLVLNIEEINLVGKIRMGNLTPIKKSIYSPNIMGPYAYIPFLECYHGIISLHHKIDGNIVLGEKNIIFDNGCGYIENDWGTSFPREYIWIHACNIEDNDTFFLSLAHIPLFNFSFTGLISILYIGDLEYRFATYNFSKIKKIKKDDNNYYIEISQNKYLLSLYLTLNTSKSLASPNKGEMIGTIRESLDSSLEIILRKKNKIIYNKKFSPCCAEVEWNV